MAFFYRLSYRIGVFIEVSVEIIGEHNAERILIHDDVTEVNATFYLEYLMKDFELSSKRRKDVFLCHLLSKHFLDADQGLKRELNVSAKVDHSNHSRRYYLSILISSRLGVN